MVCARLLISPAVAAAFLRTFYDKLAPVIKKAGIKAD